METTFKSGDIVQITGTGTGYIGRRGEILSIDGKTAKVLLRAMFGTLRGGPITFWLKDLRLIQRGE